MTLPEDRVAELLRHAAEPTAWERERNEVTTRRRRVRPGLAVLAATSCVLAVVVVAVLIEGRGTNPRGAGDRVAVTDSGSPSPTTSAPDSTLTGHRWVPVLASPSPRAASAYVVFSADGTWHGSDGCNSFGGTYRYDTSGAFSGVLGGSTLAYCNVPHIGDWIAQAKHADITGNQLRLTSADGQLLGALTS